MPLNPQMYPPPAHPNLAPTYWNPPDRVTRHETERNFDERNLRSLVEVKGDEEDLEERLDALFRSARYVEAQLPVAERQKLVNYVMANCVRGQTSQLLRDAYPSLDALEVDLRSSLLQPESTQAVGAQLQQLAQEGSVHDFIRRLRAWKARYLRNYFREFGILPPVIAAECDRQMLTRLMLASKQPHQNILLTSQPKSWAEAVERITTAILPPVNETPPVVMWTAPTPGHYKPDKWDRKSKYGT